MAHVTVISRTEVAPLPDLGVDGPIVEVAFSTEQLAPARTHLPLGLYRPATPEERAQNPRYGVYPKDAAAEASERAAIAAAIGLAQKAAPHTFEV